MNRYMNRLMYHESILFMQPITKKAKMNQLMVLESRNRLSTTPSPSSADVINGSTLSGIYGVFGDK